MEIWIVSNMWVKETMKAYASLGADERQDWHHL
jgi:hypothetical protein